MAMKERLIVMNGRCVLQQQQGETWKDVNVEKAGALTPGIYNLSTAVTADRTKTHEGVILHITKDAVFQVADKTVLTHRRAAFAHPPAVGVPVSIRYEQDRALLTARSPTQKRGITR